MFIKNPRKLQNKPIVVNKAQAEYLIGRNFVLLGRENDQYFFANIPELQEALKKMPVWFLLKKFL